MQVDQNVLRTPKNSLEIVAAYDRLNKHNNGGWKTLLLLAGIPWLVVFGVVVLIAIFADCPWPLFWWLVLIGGVIAMAIVPFNRRKQELRRTLECLGKDASLFVIRDQTLNDDKKELVGLANETLDCCRTVEQQEEVLRVYYAVATDLLAVDGATEDNRAKSLEVFQEGVNNLRYTRDRVNGENALMLIL